MGSHNSRGPHGGATTDRFFHRHGYTQTPQVIGWMVTERCELRCAHCLARSSRLAPEPSLDEAMAVIDQVADLGVGELLLTGGEPLAREDLPELLAHLHRRAVPYSLNVARAPSREQREALRRHPPMFAAVSLDGPRRLHDELRGHAGAFDEALEAIDLFRRLGVEVAAGTTVTRWNLDQLPETLAVVAHSGARSWGLHLLLPEGRALDRPELFLRPRELHRLLRFVAEKRTYLSVEIADELGYCGELEPLLRDLPMTCGAGRTQCVVLADGEVVPCTTTDRSTSAGNLFERPLGEIWRQGFTELRDRRPSGRCRRCQSFAACAGGCWLQRHRDQECYQDHLASGALLKTAAGAVLALGLSTLPSCSSNGAPVASVEEPPTTDGDAPTTDGDAPTTNDADASWSPRRCPSVESGDTEPASFVGYDGRGFSYPLGTPIDRVVLYWTFRQVDPSETPEPELPEDRPRGDPGWELVEAILSGQLPEDLSERSELIRRAVCTSERSMGLVALMWRMAAEALLEGPPPLQRSASDQEMVRELMLDLSSATGQWRRMIYSQRLDPYLAAGRQHPQWAAGWRLKSGPPRPPWWLQLHRETLEERWGSEHRALTSTAQDQWLARHPQAESLRLPLGPAPRVSILRPAGEVPVGEGEHLGIFDLLLTPESEITVQVGRLDGTTLPVTLPPTSTLTWIDLVRLAHEQHRGELEREARQRLVGRRAYQGRGQTEPLLLPAMWAERESRRRARLWLADIFLF